MFRIAPRLSAGLPLLLAGAILFFAASPASAQWLVRRRSVGVGGPVVSYSLNSSLFGFGRRPLACVPTPIGPVCAPLGGGRSLGLGGLFFPSSLCNRSVFARPPVIINPAPVYHDSTPFVYPSTNLTYFSTGSLGAGSRDVHVNTSTYSPKASLLGAQAPNSVSPPPRNESAPMYGIRSVPVGQALGDRAIASALKEFEKRPANAPAHAAAFADAQRPDTKPGTPLDDLDLALLRGDEAFARSDYRAAIEQYERARGLLGEDAGVRVSYGLTLFALGRFIDASKSMQFAASRPERLDPTAFDLRSAYGRSTEFAAHLSRLESFVAAHPRNADAQFLLGFIRAATGDQIGAKTAMSQYLKMPSANRAVVPFIDVIKRLGT